MRHLVTPADIVLQYCRDADVPEQLVLVLTWPLAKALSFFSSLKTSIHQHIDQLDDQWVNFMDLANLAGYPKMEHRQMKDDPVRWLSTPSDSLYSADWWASRFAATYGPITRNGAVLPLEDYVVNRWLWVTSGATRLSRAELDGKQVKTKFGAALSLSDAELLSAVKDIAPIKVFMKPDEPGFKRRLIANVSLGQYISASYVKYVLDSYCPRPGFLKLSTTPFDTIDVIALIRDGHLMVPLDESEYDYHVSRESWDGFFSFIKSTFPQNPGLRYLENFYREGVWQYEKIRGRWLSGMPSGLALTSYLNSWMNYIKQTHLCPGYVNWAAGDDVLASPFTGVASLELLEREYSKFGSSLNATKNWKSHKWAEFLKVVYHNKGTLGYPARVYSSLIWAVDVRTFLPSDKLPELCELWKQYFDRLGRPIDEKRVARDLSLSVSSKVAGFSSAVSLEWLHCPRARGGFGLLPYNDSVFEWDALVMRRLKYTNVIIRVPDVNFYADKVTLRKTYRHRQLLNFKLGPPLFLPKPTTMVEWEQRLNHDDTPLKGKYATMALDVIPLPVINGVSTNVMSSFAKMWHFNVYPNIYGNSSKIEDRLISASLGLASQVLSWMSNYQIKFLAN